LATILSSLFCHDLELLASSEQGLQRARDRFSAACNQAATKFSPKKTLVLCLSRNSCQSGEDLSLGWKV